MNAQLNTGLRHFNPFRMRKLRMLEAILFFNRVDRRMHNKQLTVDGRFSIVGECNIGDEYFGGSEESGFAGLDVPYVTAGCLRYRRSLLEAGAGLWEMTPVQGGAAMK